MLMFLSLLSCIKQPPSTSPDLWADDFPRVNFSTLPPAEKNPNSCTSSYFLREGDTAACEGILIPLERAEELEFYFRQYAHVKGAYVVCTEGRQRDRHYAQERYDKLFYERKDKQKAADQLKSAALVNVLSVAALLVIVLL